MAHTYDTKTNSARSNGSPKTFNHTCGSGVTLLVLSLVIDGGTERSGGAPTYNGVALTQAGGTQKAADSPETNVELWYLLKPGTGSSYQISIPNSGSVYITAEASSYKASGGNKSKLRLSGGNNGTGSYPYISSVALDFKPNDLMVSVFGSGYDSFPGPTVRPTGVTFTSLYYVDDGTYGSSSHYALFTYELSCQYYFNFNTSEDYAICYAVFTEESDLADNQIASSKTNVYSVLYPPGKVNVSKTNVYSVLGMFPGVNVSKATAYGVLRPPDTEISVSKALAYAVLSTEQRIVVSKVLAYAVLAPPPEEADNRRPFVMIIG